MKKLKHFLKLFYSYLKPMLVLAIAFISFKYLFYCGIAYALVAALVGRANGEARFTSYLWNLAVSIDQTLNVLLQYSLNDTMIKNSSKNKYGNPDETISGITGKNVLASTLTWFGKLVNSGLNLLERNHSIKSIEADE
jgi:hypothetical protein